MAINTTQSTAQILSQNREAAAQAQIADPNTGGGFRAAANPIGLISSGLNTLGRSLNAPAQREVDQANADRANSIRLEQQQYTRGQQQAAVERNQANADRQFDATQANTSFNQARLTAADDRATTQFNQGQQQNQARAALDSQVADFTNSLNANAQLVQAGDESGASYDQLTQQKNDLIASITASNNADDNIYNDVDISALDTQLTNQLDNNFKLNPINQNIFQGYSNEEAAVRDQAVQQNEAARQRNLQPVDEAVSTLTQLKTDGKLQSGVNYAVSNLPGYEGNADAIQELAQTANEVVTKFEKANPALKKHPYRQEILAYAVQNTAPNDRALGEDDFTEYLEGDLGSPLAQNIATAMQLFTENSARISSNDKINRLYDKRIQDAQDAYSKNTRNKAAELELRQGLKVNR